MTLCLAFGCPSVSRLQKSISSTEFNEWLAYNQLSPIGAERADLNAGYIAAAVYNTNRAEKTDKIWQPSDFSFENQGKSVKATRKDPRELEAMAMRWAKTHNRCGNVIIQEKQKRQK